MHMSPSTAAARLELRMEDLIRSSGLEAIHCHLAPRHTVNGRAQISTGSGRLDTVARQIWR